VFFYKGCFLCKGCFFFKVFYKGCFFYYWKTQNSDKDNKDDDAAQEENELYFYEILVDNIIVRLRFSRFIAICKAKNGMEGETVLEEVLKHGRLSPKDIIQNTISSIIEKKRKDEVAEFVVDGKFVGFFGVSFAFVLLIVCLKKNKNWVKL